MSCFSLYNIYIYDSAFLRYIFSKDTIYNKIKELANFKNELKEKHELFVYLLLLRVSTPVEVYECLRLRSSEVKVGCGTSVPCPCFLRELNR